MLVFLYAGCVFFLFATVFCVIRGLQARHRVLSYLSGLQERGEIDEYGERAPIVTRQPAARGFIRLIPPLARCQSYDMNGSSRICRRHVSVYWMARMIEQKLLSNLSFEPYLATIIHMAGDGCRWSRGAEDEDPQHVFARASERVSQVCAEQRGQLEWGAASTGWRTACLVSPVPMACQPKC